MDKENIKYRIVFDIFAPSLRMNNNVFYVHLFIPLFGGGVSWQELYWCMFILLANVNTNSYSIFLYEIDFFVYLCVTIFFITL